ncbi:Fic family protein [Paracidovorax citrulli]
MPSPRELEERILRFLSERTRAGFAEQCRGDIARALALPSATAYRYLNRLVEAGKLTRAGRGRATTYRLCDPQQRPAAVTMPGFASYHQSHHRSYHQSYPGLQYSLRPPVYRGMHLVREPGEGPAGLYSGQVDGDAIAWSAASLQLRAKLDVPTARRTPVGYQRSFVESYEPNGTFLLPQDVAEALYEEGRMQGQQLAGTYARRVLGSMLIDLSYSSSHLEGNRYSRLDTEMLFREGRGEAACRDATDKDATMLLNHKQAIELLVELVPRRGMSADILCNVHVKLMNGLLRDEALGTIRDEWVRIGGSVYLPPQGPEFLEDMFGLIVEKADRIINPVEAAFFLWVNLAYLQPFEDGNKRTSRLGANIPLMLYNCAPLSFLDVCERDYVLARLGVYEHCDTSIAADLFAWTYRRSIRKYAEELRTTPPVDPLRARYREHISEAVGSVVRDRVSPREAVDSLGLDTLVRAQLLEMMQGDLRRLGLHNYTRYRLTMAEVEQWNADGRPVRD